MKPFTIRHTTTYRYRQPVRFERHRLMIRPRDSHDVRLVESSLVISVPSSVNWIHDVFGNSIALVDFKAPADTLVIQSVLRLVRYTRRRTSSEVSPEARLYPFVYAADDRIDLGHMGECHYENSIGVLSDWLAPFIRKRDIPSLDLLSTISRHIRETLVYEARYSKGTQSPKETLALRSGTCRDFAVLFVEAARHLGFGARFVTGYLYDRALDPNTTLVIRGAQSTHAWAEIYIPGPGWVEYDPTNDLVDSPHLIRVAVTRDASQAIPVTGTFLGQAEDFIAMDVDVTVSEDQTL